MCCNSDSNSAKAPDYGPMAASSDKAAEMGYELGQQQLAETRRQYENNMNVARPVVDAQMGLMEAQQKQGDDYYNYQKNTFRPVEEGLVKDATEFNTADAKERFARQAATDLQTQQANQEGQERRAMTSMGVNPNSGRFQGLESARRITNAAQRAGATTNARERADNLSWAKRMDAAGLGRNLTGASQASYGLAANAGTQAVGNNAQAGNAMVAGMSAANGTAMQGQSMGIQGLSSVLGAQSGNYKTSVSANAQNTTGMGQLLGAGLGAAATYFR